MDRRGGSLTPKPLRPAVGPGPWAELVLGAAVVYGRALARLTVPAVILELPSRIIRVANQPMADLLGVSLQDLIGRVNTDVIAFDDPGPMLRAVAAVSAGEIDGYRARRTVTARDGSRQDAYVWCRAVDLQGVRSAAFLISRVGESMPAAAGLPVLALEPMAVGISIRGGPVEWVSAEIRDILGVEPEEVIGRSILTEIHPDDVGGFNRELDNAAVGDMVLAEVHLRSRGGAWVAVRLLTINLNHEGPRRVAFAMLRRPDDAEEVSAERLNELEVRLRRIAAEVRATGLLDEFDRVPSMTEHPELNRLSTRQWQILSLLLRGDRVPTIAAELHLSPSTVRNYLSAIFVRFGVHSQAELIARLRDAPRR